MDEIAGKGPKIAKLRNEIANCQKSDQLELVEIVCEEEIDYMLVGREGYKVTAGRDMENKYLGVDIRVKKEGEFVPIEGYKVETKKLYHKCDDCSVKKMFDEKNKTHYCPICDSVGERLMDKIF